MKRHRSCIGDEDTVVIDGSVLFAAPAAGQAWAWTVPPNAGTAGQVLETDGKGITTWQSAVPGIDTSKLPLAGGTMTGDIDFGGFSARGISSIVGAVATNVSLQHASGGEAASIKTLGLSMSKDLIMNSFKVTGLGTPAATTDATTKTYVDAADGKKLSLSGGTMSGAIAMGTSQITGLGNPSLAQDAVTKTYVDSADALSLPLTGGTMSGAIAMGSNAISGITTATGTTWVGAVTGHASLDLPLTGGTMSGAIAMGSNAISGITTATGTTWVGAVTGHASLDLPLTGGTMSGAIAMGSNAISGITTATGTTWVGAVTGHASLDLPLTGGTMSGAIAMGSNAISGITTATGTTWVGAVTGHASLDLALTGGTMSGAIAMGSSKITGLGTPTATTDATTKTYVDTADALKLSLSGGTMTGDLGLGIYSFSGPSGASLNFNNTILRDNNNGVKLAADASYVEFFALGTINHGPFSSTGTINLAGATGDLLLGNGTTMATKTIGSTGDVLTVSGGTAIWRPPTAYCTMAVTPAAFALSAATWTRLNTASTSIGAAGFSVAAGTGRITYTGTATRLFNLSLSISYLSDTISKGYSSYMLNAGAVSSSLSTNTAASVTSHYNMSWHYLLQLATNDTIDVALYSDSAATWTIDSCQLQLVSVS
jgi:fibronectin-binding autotransporter adhesin